MRVLFTFLLLICAVQSMSAQQKTTEYKTFDFTWYVYDMPDLKYENIHNLFEVSRELDEQYLYASNRKGGLVTEKEYRIFKECIELMKSNSPKVKKYTATKKITIKKETTIENGKKNVDFYIVIPNNLTFGDRLYPLAYNNMLQPTNDFPFYVRDYILPYKDSLTSDSIYQPTSFKEKLMLNSDNEMTAQTATFMYDISYQNQHDFLTRHSITLYIRTIYPQIVQQFEHNYWSLNEMYQILPSLNSCHPYNSFHIVEMSNQKKYLRILLSSSSKTVDEINKFLFPNHELFAPFWNKD